MKASRAVALGAAGLVLAGAVAGVGVWRGWLSDSRGWFTEPSVSGATELRLPEGAVRPLATGLRAPWGLAFLPDGTALVTERDTARILSVGAGGQVTEVQRLAEVRPGGEGGLLGIAVSPSYAQDRWVYVYYTAESDNRIARLRLGGRPEPILTGLPSARVHNGGRIAFGPDGMLYVGTGDAGERDQAQDRTGGSAQALLVRAYGRLRHVAVAPDGALWVLTSNRDGRGSPARDDDRILRVTV
ncbi:MAG TPA: PQQ-dependent sugar dehydrogenase [Micromonosporaceae bacterium]|nr:PQQ-dependent sugar dehydrogenase [Micromonosporaceae bacterium]